MRGRGISVIPMERKKRLLINRVLIAGQFWHGSLEKSYARAFELEGATVEKFDLNASLMRYVRYGRLGALFNQFIPVEAWHNKLNRDLILKASLFQPDLIVVGGAGPVRVGALAQIRASIPGVRMVLLWPDTLTRLLPHVPPCLPIYDLVASYASSAVTTFERIGARHAEWIPLGADLELHSSNDQLTSEDREKFDCDVVFVGNHRPEREEAILTIAAAGISIKVWGHNDWRRHARNQREVMRHWQGRPLYGTEFSKAVRCASLALNPIDPTNFPAANMRFFEVPACGGVALNSACPEMAKVFTHCQSCFYYEKISELSPLVQDLLKKPEMLLEVSETGRMRVRAGHTYRHRVRQILHVLSTQTS